MASDEEVLSEELHNESVSSYIENILVLQFVLLLFHLIALFYIVRNIIRIPKNGTNYYLLSFLFGIIVFNTAVIERYLHRVLDYDWNFGETAIGCKLFYILEKIDFISLLTVLALLIHWILKITFSLDAKRNLEIYLSLFMIVGIWGSIIMNLIPEISILNMKYENNMLHWDSDQLKSRFNSNFYELITFAFPLFELVGLLYLYIFVVIIKTNMDLKEKESYSSYGQLLKWKAKTCLILVVMTATFFCHLFIKSMGHLHGRKMTNYDEEFNFGLRNIWYLLPLEILCPILLIISGIMNPILCVRTSKLSNRLSHFEFTNEYSPVPIYTIDVKHF